MLLRDADYPRLGLDDPNWHKIGRLESGSTWSAKEFRTPNGHASVFCSHGMGGLTGSWWLPALECEVLALNGRVTFWFEDGSVVDPPTSLGLFGEVRVENASLLTWSYGELLWVDETGVHFHQIDVGEIASVSQINQSLLLSIEMPWEELQSQVVASGSVPTISRVALPLGSPKETIEDDPPQPPSTG